MIDTREIERNDLKQTPAGHAAERFLDRSDATRRDSDALRHLRDVMRDAVEERAGTPDPAWRHEDAEIEPRRRLGIPSLWSLVAVVVAALVVFQAAAMIGTSWHQAPTTVASAPDRP